MHLPRRDPARERIELAAVDLVGRRGLGASSVEAICDEARVSPSHFWRCFADLDDCVLGLHDEIAAELGARISSQHGVDRWHDRVWAAGWETVRFLREDHARARFLLMVSRRAPSSLARRDPLLRQFADVLARGCPGEPDDGTASRTAEIAADVVSRTIAAKVEGGALERGEEFLPELVRVAVMPFLGARAAEEELSVLPLPA